MLMRISHDPSGTHVMPLAAQVTSLFYLIDAATNDVVEGGKVDQQRPPWLGGLPMHLMASPLSMILRLLMGV